MDNGQIKIEVNGKSLTARKGQMLIEVTDANDIYVPRFCYHNKLTVAANCRMCLVEVEKAPKPLPACATPVIDGMKVHTQSAKATEAQKSIMEFLLINHPLDCPICDQGGECELQDLAMGYGRDVSRYQEKKRVVQDKNIGTLIQTDLTRCIHCTRCVRFGEEIAGLRELGATGRGEGMTIGTYIEKSLASELSGNIIDLCPVGALTSKPFRYSARTWELTQRTGVAPHDSVGSNIHFHIKENQVKRIVPANNEAINEVWLSDRDRFSYQGIYSDERLTTPLIKDNGEWKAVAWEVAFEHIKTRLNQLIESHGADKLGTIASPSATVEELYLLQKLSRSLGSHNIDSRLKQVDFSDQDSVPVFPWLGRHIAEFESVDAALLIGSHLRKEQPIINHRLRKAVLAGAKVMLLNLVDHDFNYDIASSTITTPAELATETAAVLKAVFELTASPMDEPVKAALSKVKVSAQHQQIAKTLVAAEDAIVLLGNSATAHPQFSLLRTLAGQIATHSNADFGYLTEAANCAGAWLAGAVPHRLAAGQKSPITGMNTQQMLEACLPAYLLLGIEPELDCWDSQLAYTAMQNAELVISLSAYSSDAIKSYADVMLPIAVFAETAGTYINNAGNSQFFNGAVPPLGEARPAWKVLRVLGNVLGLAGFDYQTVTDVYAECMHEQDTINGDNIAKWRADIELETAAPGLQRITETPMYSVDALVRRATALQQTGDIADGAIHINQALATQHQLTDADQAKVAQADNSTILKVVIDDKVPNDCVLIQAAHPKQVALGAAFGPISISKS